jgi:hypothetical protein
VGCYSEHCGLGNDGVKELCKMQQLSELHLDNATENAGDGNNIYTVDGFITVLNSLEKMPKLTTLVMQLPHVKELKISRLQFTEKDGRGIGDRGV